MKKIKEIFENVWFRLAEGVIGCTLCLSVLIALVMGM